MIWALQGLGFRVYLGIPHHDVFIPGAGVYDTITLPHLTQMTGRVWALQGLGFRVYLGIPDHDVPIPGAGVYEAVTPPLDTGHRAGVAREGEDAAPGVGVPHLCGAILGCRHKTPRRHF